MHTINLQAIGDVRAKIIEGMTLVCLNDITAAFEIKTPVRVLANRTLAIVHARVRDGRYTLHMIDLPSAAAVLAGARGQDRARILAAMTSLFELYAANRGQADTIAEPDYIPHLRAAETPPDPPGKTVGEMITELGLRGHIAPGHAGKTISETYRGARARCRRGVVYEDTRQLARMLQQMAR